jgi:hypothetical protein
MRNSGVTDMLPYPLKLRTINYLSIIDNTFGALPTSIPTGVHPQPGIAWPGRVYASPWVVLNITLQTAVAQAKYAVD